MFNTRLKRLNFGHNPPCSGELDVPSPDERAEHLADQGVLWSHSVSCYCGVGSCCGILPEVRWSIWGLPHHLHLSCSRSYSTFNIFPVSLQKLLERIL